MKVSKKGVKGEAFTLPLPLEKPSLSDDVIRSLSGIVCRVAVPDYLCFYRLLTFENLPQGAAKAKQFLRWRLSKDLTIGRRRYEVAIGNPDLKASHCPALVMESGYLNQISECLEGLEMVPLEVMPCGFFLHQAMRELAPGSCGDGEASILIYVTEEYRSILVINEDGRLRSLRSCRWNSPELADETILSVYGDCVRSQKFYGRDMDLQHILLAGEQTLVESFLACQKRHQFPFRVSVVSELTFSTAAAIPDHLLDIVLNRES